MPVDRLAPRITTLKLNPSRVRRGSSMRISFTLSEAAKVTLSIQRRAKARPHRLTTLKGAITRQNAAGARRLTFSGRLRGKRLAPGTYRLVLRARDTAGNRSAAVSASFTVV